MKRFLLFFMAMLLAHLCRAQFPVEDYNSSKVTWFGIDYSKTRMIGSEGFSEKKKIVDYYFEVWNDFVFKEPEKYNINSALHREDVKIELGLVNKINAAVNPDGLLHEETIEFEDFHLIEILEAYDFSAYEGLGAMFVAEYYSKTKKKASYLFVLFDMQKNTVLFTKRYTVSAGGFGFRNYWARTYYSALKELGKDMKKWMK